MRTHPCRRSPSVALLSLLFGGLAACGSMVAPRVDGAALVDRAIIDDRAGVDSSIPSASPDVLEPADVVDVVAPAPGARAIAPLSTSAVTSQRPTLSWSNAPGHDGAVIEVSRSRDFAMLSLQLRHRGTTLRVPDALAHGVWFWRLRAWDSTRDVASATASAPWWFRVGHRSADGDRDRSWGTELDVNGDGFADLAIGASDAQRSRGRVDVFYGGPAGIAARPSVTLLGQSMGDRFGSSVASAGRADARGRSEALSPSCS